MCGVGSVRHAFTRCRLSAEVHIVGVIEQLRTVSPCEFPRRAEQIGRRGERFSITSHFVLIPNAIHIHSLRRADSGFEFKP